MCTRQPSCTDTCFNPRTHTGCDFRHHNVRITACVSIHAPTRGATIPNHNKNNVDFVSIHAPTRGATGITYPMSLCYLCFNPRTHTGCDASASTLTRKVQSFNPRTHTGCDVDASIINIIPILFQSTHPHGVRPNSQPDTEKLQSFNPRTHTGCDTFGLFIVHAKQVSIHAPTRGATLPCAIPMQPHLVSIHAPTRGATRGLGH